MKLKRLWQIASVVVIAMLGMIPYARAAWSDTDGVFYLQTRDGLESEYTVNGSLVFKSQSGATIPGYRDCGIVFAPSNEGEAIQITVQEIDLTGTNYLLVYDGAIEKIGYGVSDGKDQSSYLPTGWRHKLTDASAGLTYTSTSPDGKLSFGFHSNSASGQKGFTILVESVALKDMEYVSATTSAAEVAPRRGQKGAELVNFTVVADGSSNALTVDNLTFDISGIKSNAGFSNIAVTKGGETIAKTAENSSEITVSGVKLRNGKNVFTLIGDVAPDATGTVAANVTALSVAGTARTPSVTTATTLPVVNEVWMPAGPETYTVSDNIAFYDDGGPDGKIGDQFEGTVTFVPAETGKKVKVDFSELKLFNTSSIGKNDILTFYNGRIADASKVITTLLTEAETVKSTADDGSLTVTIKSTTGVPADGWKAVVSEYVPGDMRLDHIDVAAPSGDNTTVSSTQKDAPLLLFDVITENNASPLSVNGVDLSAVNGTYLSNLHLYYIGKKSDLANRTSVADATGAHKVSMTGSKELVEGHNWFIITGDVRDNVLNGEEIGLSLTGISVGETKVTPANELSATRIVANHWSSTEGASTVTLYDDWQFTPTMTGDAYSNKYVPGTIDQIVTFVPAKTGDIAQIDFSKFNVPYASNFKATFEIYSGRTVSETAALWKLDSSEESTTGPGRVLRSEAADGSMTIRFNPNTDFSSYTREGWVATVRPFTNHDMTVISTGASRPSVGEMAVGATDQDLLDFNIVTEGTLTHKKITGVNLNVEGAEALSALKVYVSNKADMSESVLFGTCPDVKTECTVAGEFVLGEGPTYFRVKGDVKSDAAAETNVRVGVASLTDDKGNTEAVKEGNPEGSRTVKSILISEEGTFTVTVAQPLMWYDNGGKDGKIGSNVKSTYTFIPAEEGYSITLDAGEFSIGNGRMNVYNGRTVDSKNVIGTVTGYSTTKGPLGLRSTADDGSLTVYVKGPTGKTLDGFAISVGLHKKVPYTLSSLTSSAVSGHTSCLRGSRAVPLLKAVASVDGDMNDARLSDFTVSLAGTTALSDISALSLYASDGITDFSTSHARLLSTAQITGETVTFDNKDNANYRGEHNYWIVADIADNATAGNTVKVALTSASFNGSAVTATGDAAESVVKAGLSGTFTIGAENADYTSFKTATTALSEGVEGPVTFEILDGTYAENLVIENVMGTSAEHPVVFRSKSGNRDKVIIAPSYMSNQADGMVRISASPFVTLEGVTVDARTTSASYYKNAIWVGKCSRNVTIRDCNVFANKITSGYSGTNGIYSYTETMVDPGSNNDNLTIEDCAVTNGYIGLYISGCSAVANPDEKGLVIRNNTVNGSYSNGMFICDEEAPVITGNTVLWDGAKNGYVGIRPYRMKGAAVISGNRIVNTGNAYSSGIEFYDACQGDTDAPARIYNNDIVLTRSTAYSGRAIQIANACSDLDIAYNTLRVCGTAAYCVATSGSGTPTNITVRGNILQNECATSNIIVYFWNSTDADGIRFSNNAYYTGGESVCKKDSEMLTYDQFLALQPDENSILEKAAFLGDTDNHLTEAGSMQRGLAVNGITTDREGKQRPATNLTLGAYEFANISTAAPVIAEGYPVIANVTENSAEAKTRWDVDATVYYLCKEWKDGDVTPEAEKVTAASKATATAGSDLTVNLTSLQASTTFRVFFVAESAAGVKSEVIASDVFTTLRHIEPLAVSFTNDDSDPVVVNSGETVTLTPTVIGGDEPYSYRWTDQTGADLGTSATLSITPASARHYTVKVTAADDQSVTAAVPVEVRGDMVTAQFEDIHLDAESHIVPQGDTRFYSGTFAFNAGGMPEYNFWYGFTPSSETAVEFTGLEHQYRSAAGGAFNGTNYAVAYPQGLKIEVTNNEDGDVIPGVYITNNAYAYSSMTNGDGFAKKFATGDWFMVTAKGTTSDGKTVSKDFYLADMRDESEAEHYIVNTWEWLDLRSLGAVKDLTFTFDGSDKGTYGLNTPTYICLDRLGEMPVMSDTTVTVSEKAPVDLDNIFNPDNTAASKCLYAVEPMGENPFSLAVDGTKLKIVYNEGNVPEDLSVGEFMASLTRAGHTEYKHLTVTYDKSSGVSDIAVSGNVTITPTVVSDHFTVSTTLTDFAVRVFSTDGTCVYASEGNNDSVNIRREGWSAGMYIVHVSSARGNVARRIVLK